MSLDLRTQTPRFAIEIKWSDAIVTHPRELRGLIELAGRHRLSRRPLVTTRTLSHQLQINETLIDVVPVALHCYTIAKNLLRSRKQSPAAPTSLRHSAREAGIQCSDSNLAAGTEPQHPPPPFREHGMGWLDAQRLATALVMPLSLELLLGLIGLALVWRALLGLTARWRVLLVTSAWNLRRAVALFEQAGFEVPPVAADDRSFPSCRALQCQVPSAGALEASGLALKEVLGDAVQVRAWPGRRRDDSQELRLP